MKVQKISNQHYEVFTDTAEETTLNISENDSSAFIDKVLHECGLIDEITQNLINNELPSAVEECNVKIILNSCYDGHKIDVLIGGDKGLELDDFPEIAEQLDDELMNLCVLLHSIMDIANNYADDIPKENGADLPFIFGSALQTLGLAIDIENGFLSPEEAPALFNVINNIFLVTDQTMTGLDLDKQFEIVFDNRMADFNIDEDDIYTSMLEDRANLFEKRQQQAENDDDANNELSFLSLVNDARKNRIHEKRAYYFNSLDKLADICKRLELDTDIKIYYHPERELYFIISDAISLSEYCIDSEELSNYVDAYLYEHSEKICTIDKLLQVFYE